MIAEQGYVLGTFVAYDESGSQHRIFRAAGRVAHRTQYYVSIHGHDESRISHFIYSLALERKDVRG